jgi:TPP-dependent pyruvate/acetoin dehydrogenase alpha subunit
MGRGKHVTGGGPVDIRDLYRTMLRIRRFEEAVQRLNKRGRLSGFVHLYIGEEAVATGACAALSPGDWITSTHRGHGHLIARGGDVRRMMAELMGKALGYSHGKGGSMHIADLSLGILGANGIVGAGLPIATGAALAEKMQGSSKVAICFFGDGASNTGSFHEAINLAAVWAVPVIYVCENNGYTELTSMSELTACGAVVQRAAAYGIPGAAIDGNDVELVRETVAEAVNRARAGAGPSLIEARTYRLEDHNEGLEQVTGTRRPPDEVARWRALDPIVAARERCIDLGSDASELEALDAAVSAEIEEAVAFADRAPLPDPRTAYDEATVMPSV